jgi:hypothetical protein
MTVAFGSLRATVRGETWTGHPSLVAVMELATATGVREPGDYLPSREDVVIAEACRILPGLRIVAHSEPRRQGQA